MNTNMKAIILAAGVGKRLKPLTNKIPKPLIEINEKPLIEHDLEGLYQAGIKEVKIVVGHLKEKIIEKIGNKYKNINIHYIENPIFDKTGSLYSLWLARDFIDGDFIFMDADLYFHPKLIKELINTNTKNAILVGSLLNDCGEEVKVYTNGKIATYISKNINISHKCVGEAVGINKFSKEIINIVKEEMDELIKKNINTEHEELTQNICNKKLMNIVSTNLPWIEIDFKEDIEKAESLGEFKMHETIFFGPMSNNLSQRVKDAISKGEICHREIEFMELLKNVRKKLLEMVNAGDSYSTVMFTGSGSAAMEAVISSVPKEGYLAILNNGHYSDRLAKIAKSYNINITEMNIGDNYPDLKELEKVLSDEKITHLAMVHHETVTGLLNPLTDIGQLCKKLDKKLIVDIISTVATEDIDVVRDNISFLMASSNKGIQGPEGLSFVIAKKESLEEMKNTTRNYYLNLYMNYEFQEIKGQCPFTPAVRVFSGLNEALDELNDEGLKNRIKRYKELAKTVREGLAKLGFEFPIKPEHMSNTVTTLYLLENMEYDDLHDKLKKKGFVIYGCKPLNNRKTFRICTYGDIFKEDVERFLKVFGEVLKEYK